MTRIVCGFCGQSTAETLCAHCRHDPRTPYLQRGDEPIELPEPEAGRPGLDLDEVRRKLSRASSELSNHGRPVTVEGLAGRLVVSVRTGRWWLGLMQSWAVCGRLL